jgi:hypothetical protein
MALHSGPIASRTVELGGHESDQAVIRLQTPIDTLTGEMPRKRCCHTLLCRHYAGAPRRPVEQRLRTTAPGPLATLAARALGDQAAGALNAGRAELGKFHVFKR